MRMMDEMSIMLRGSVSRYGYHIMLSTLYRGIRAYDNGQSSDIFRPTMAI